MDPAAIRTALKTQLETQIPGLNVYEHGYSSVEIPAALIAIPEIDYQVSMRGDGGQLNRLKITLICVLGTADERDSLPRLDGYAATTGPTSIQAALRADRYLGGAVHQIVVKRLIRAGKYNLGNVDV